MDNRMLIAGLIALTLVYAAGCGDIKEVNPESGGTEPPTTSATATVEQSVFISTTNGTTYDAGFLQYLWYYHETFHTTIQEKVFMKFDVSLIPSGSTIKSAELSIYITTYEASCTTIIAQVDETWDRTTITVSNQPANSLVVAFKDSALGWNTFNIKTIVQKWVSGTIPNYGVLIGPYGSITSGSNKTQMLDYDDAAYYPRIAISYY